MYIRVFQDRFLYISQTADDAFGHVGVVVVVASTVL